MVAQDGFFTFFFFLPGFLHVYNWLRLPLGHQILIFEAIFNIVENFKFNL